MWSLPPSPLHSTPPAARVHPPGSLPVGYTVCSWLSSLLFPVPVRGCRLGFCLQTFSLSDPSRWPAFSCYRPVPRLGFSLRPRCIPDCPQTRPFPSPGRLSGSPLVVSNLGVLDSSSCSPSSLTAFRELVSLLASIPSLFFLEPFSSAVELGCGHVLPSSEITRLSTGVWPGGEEERSLLDPHEGVSKVLSIPEALRNQAAAVAAVMAATSVWSSPAPSPSPACLSARVGPACLT